MAEVFEELVRARECYAETRFRARWEELGVNVRLVLRDHDVLRAVEGGDRKTTD